MDIPKQKQPKMRIKKTPIPTLTEDNIEEVYNNNFNKIDLDDNNFNTFLFKKEELDSKIISQNGQKYNNLYSTWTDKNRVSYLRPVFFQISLFTF